MPLARELARDAVAHARLAEVDVAEGVQAAQAAREVLLLGGPRRRDVRLDELAAGTPPTRAS